MRRNILAGSATLLLIGAVVIFFWWPEAEIPLACWLAGGSNSGCRLVGLRRRAAIAQLVAADNARAADRVGALVSSAVGDNSLADCLGDHPSGAMAGKWKRS